MIIFIEFTPIFPNKCEPVWASSVMGLTSSSSILGPILMEVNAHNNKKLLMSFEYNINKYFGLQLWL